MSLPAACSHGAIDGTLGIRALHYHALTSPTINRRCGRYMSSGTLGKLCSPVKVKSMISETDQLGRELAQALENAGIEPTVIHQGVDQVATAATMAGEAGTMLSEGMSMSTAAATAAAMSSLSAGVGGSSPASASATGLGFHIGMNISLAEWIRQAVESVAAVLPDVLRPFFMTLADDVGGVLSLHPTIGGSFRLAVFYYFVIARPSPLVGILDFYILGPLVRVTRKQFNEQDFTLRNRLGNGNYGQVYEGLRNKKIGEPDVASTELTSEQKSRRVVLKKTNIDREGIRANFLRSGTIARGAGETGQVEDYVCTRISAHPSIRPIAAEYLGNFVADSSTGGITAGTQWLIWRFESDATLADACAGALGPFPECLANIMLGTRRAESLGQKDPAKRDSAAIKMVMYKLLKGLDKLHSLGIVHRYVI